MTIGEKLVQFQNQAEHHFVKKKSLKTSLVYLVALIVFFSSTLFAFFTWPVRYILKKSKSKKTKGIINLSATNINEIVSANDSLLLNFTADWCGPCLLMSDILEKFALSKDSVVIGKINIDTNSGLTKKYNIRGVPQFLLIKNGIEIKRHVGPMTGKELEKFYE
jgi:thiol-disulfide isomerase/thioredoxin